MFTSRSKCVLTAILALFSCASFSQSFTFTAADTVLTGPLGSEIVFNTTITNTSSAVLTLTIIRTLNDLPQGWESSLCFDACFPSTIDSITTTPAFGSSPLNPGDSRAFSVHVYAAGNHGTGTVRIVVKNSRNSSEQTARTFRASTTPNDVPIVHAQPLTLALWQNFPNPFNPTTEIRYELFRSEHVTLEVLDMLGREVALLVDEGKTPGMHRVTFTATPLPSGTYFCRLRAGDQIATRKLLLLR